MMQLSQKDIVRFWSKVDRAQEGCWEWQAGTDKDGYGGLIVALPGSTRKAPLRVRHRAHRISWQLAFGAIPAGMVVCHRCDNRKCVRPDHLFIGTPSDNTQDRIRKGRSARGEHTGYYRHPEKYRDFGKTENARKARERTAAMRSARTLAYHLPRVIAGIRNVIAQGIKPTKHNCQGIPGYFSIIGRFKTHSELVAMARQEVQ